MEFLLYFCGYLKYFILDIMVQIHLLLGDLHYDCLELRAHISGSENRLCVIHGC